MSTTPGQPPPPPGTPEPRPTTTPPPTRAPDAARDPAAGPDTPSTWQPMLWLRLLLLLAALAYVIAFVVKNTREIPIDFVFTTASVRLIWEILLLLAIGILSGVLLSQLYRRNARRDLRKGRAKPGDAGRDLGRRDEAVGKPR